ncbi:hypothetical protein N7512_009849 [Penicillium capsulatum]|nr:hypothetical protein N7512_009849 [Penicillium capsulatum]
MVGRVKVLRGNPNDEAGLREQGIYQGSNCAALVDGEGTILCPPWQIISTDDVMNWELKLTGGQKSSCMSTTISAGTNRSSPGVAMMSSVEDEQARSTGDVKLEQLQCFGSSAE